MYLLIQDTPQELLNLFEGYLSSDDRRKIAQKLSEVRKNPRRAEDCCVPPEYRSEIFLRILWYTQPNSLDILKIFEEDVDLCINYDQIPPTVAVGFVERS